MSKFSITHDVFVGLYVEGIDRLLERRDWTGMALFLAIARRCGADGMTWVSDGGLAKALGIHEDNIPAMMARISKYDWVRVHYIRQPDGRDKRHLQVSPFIVRGARKNQNAILRSWLNGNQFVGLAESAEADTEKKIEADIADGVDEAEKADTEKIPPKTSLSRNLKEKTNGHVTENRKKALAKEIADDFARENDYGSTYVQMQRYIETYGYNRVKWAYGVVKQRQKSGKIDSPGGLLVTILRGTK